MKKLFVVALVLLVAVGMTVTAVSAAPKGIDINGEHYNLNIHFKKNLKEEWSASSTDRHTIFLPYITPEESIYLDGCIDFDGDGVIDNYDDATESCIPMYIDGVKMVISQGEEWAVLDANGGDGVCELQLPEGKYKVFVVARGKPGGYTDIDGWVYYDGYTEEYGEDTYFFDLGDVRVTKKTEWDEITDLFYIEPKQDTYGVFADEFSPFYEQSSAWVFDYLNYLYDEYEADGGYFWQIVNGGNKLVKVRFYPV
ncbi:hypothetical protein [Methanovulcanius yangii]|uniref:hypothetical protein n=1 Tax=Methanovulcanius yangii TaxID=1789227 RepID=UPI0029CA4DAC|nr:hypothetical protein [Methanovulcanius yangii]